MHGSKRHLTVAVALTCWLVALTGSALAAPPSEPPGQAKKAEEPAAQPAPAPAPPSNANAPGQQKKAQPAPPKSHGVNATTEGKKPSSTTQKNQWTTAGHKPDVSKRYGNGKTAAQIATSRGAPADEKIYGPGNSQPHKVCGKNGHYIDVHAVKTYTGTRCSAQSSTSSSAAPIAGTSQPASASAGSNASATGSSASATGSSAPAGGVLGAEHTSSREAGGVAGAFATIGDVAAGTLPFTGFPLWAAVLLALVAIALGVTLWRHGRSPTTRDVV
jgi:hypothetical protein